MPTIREQIAARAQAAKKAKAEGDKARELRRKAREKDREKAAKALATLPTGLSRNVVNQIQAAAKKAEEDPEARAMLQRAQDLHRVQRLKRARGGDLSKPNPDRFMMGIPLEDFNEMRSVKDVEKALPPFPSKSMAEMRRTKQKPRPKQDKVRAVVDAAKRVAEQKAPLPPPDAPESPEAYTDEELERMTAPGDS